MKTRTLSTNVATLAATLLVFAGSAVAQNIAQAKAESSRASIGAATISKLDEASMVQPGERYPRYHINREDVIALSFPLSPEFNQKLTVQPDGYLNLQGADSVYVLGKTVPELKLALRAAYSKVLHDPIVDVDLVDFQKAMFIVFGQVTKPGQYDLRYDLTVSQAIAVAGGFMPTAKTQVFLYRRLASGGTEIRELKLKDVLQGKNPGEDVFMKPGDMIFVPEKFIAKFRKYVPYYVGVSTDPMRTLL